MITIKLFAVLKDRAGRSELQIPFPGGTVEDLLKELAGAHPPLAKFLSPARIMVSVNQEFVKSDAAIKDGDEIALMPPFSGGSASAGHGRIQEEPFALDQVTDG